LLVLCGGAGCWRQHSTVAPDLKTHRQIELIIRSHYDIPADYGVGFGHMGASKIPGYDELPVTFSQGDQHVDFTFLVSRDRRWLARLQRFDLHEDLSTGIDITGHPVRGNPRAKVTVVVYDDLQCPFCSRFAEQVLPQVLNRYNGQIRVVYKDYPISEIHSWATHAAINANCLAKQSPDAYWEYVDHVHTHYAEFKGDKKDLRHTLKKLDDLAFKTSANAPNSADLRSCIAAQDDASIKRSVEEADKLNVQSTPTVYVNGERIVGFTPKEWLSSAIDRALSATN
jgi:protein-disulfide isomerase